jgi:AcrR family transcriptional regulator
MAQHTERRRGHARELARQAMKSQVSGMALDLFDERGYASVTVEDICAVAGISRSTFFRYFSAKEDVLLDELADAGSELLAALQERPEGEAPWTALRRALDPLIEQYGAGSGGSDRALRLARLTVTTPALAAWHHEKTRGWHELLRPEITRRLGGGASEVADPRATALIGSAIACVDAALAAWVAAEGAEALDGILDRAMQAISD